MTLYDYCCIYMHLKFAVFFLKFGSRVSWRSGKLTPCCYVCDINLPCMLQLLQVVNCSDCSTLSDSLSRNGEYYREIQDLANNLKTKFDPYRNRWGKWLVSKKVSAKLAFKQWLLHEIWTKDSQDIVIRKQWILQIGRASCRERV